MVVAAARSVRASYYLYYNNYYNNYNYSNHSKALHTKMWSPCVGFTPSFTLWNKSTYASSKMNP